MITWKQKLGHPECPYMIRWILDFKLFSIRLHHWISSDDPRHFHDHPWNFISLVISGYLIDRHPGGDSDRVTWSISKFPARHKHTVMVPECGAWTIMLTGPVIRKWGFWVNGRFRKRNRYFYDYRHHPCE